MNRTNTNYIFPKKIADRMALVSQKTQYESQMFGTLFLMLGLVLSGIYFFFYFNFALWYKIVLILNLLAGIVVMGISIITTYQQYLAYMAAIELQRQLNPGIDNVPEITPKKAKKIRYISGVIISLIGLAILILLTEYHLGGAILAIGTIIGLVLLIYGIYILLNTKKFIKDKIEDPINTMKGGIEVNG